MSSSFPGGNGLWAGMSHARGNSESLKVRDDRDVIGGARGLPGLLFGQEGPHTLIKIINT